MQADGSLPEWDFEWDYTMGLPDSPTLSKTWYHYTSGTIATNIVSDGLRLGNASIIGYNMYTSDAPHAIAVNGNGVIEAKMKVKRRASNAAGFGRLVLGTGVADVGVAIAFSAKSGTSGNIYLCDNSTFDLGTKIGTFSSDVFKVVRLVLENNIGSVYLDGVKVKDNIDPTTIYVEASSAWGAFNFREAPTGHYATYEYVKVKSGRV